MSEALDASRPALETRLDAEAIAEKQADRAYWQPLKQEELEALRRQART